MAMSTTHRPHREAPEHELARTLAGTMSPESHEPHAPPEEEGPEWRTCTHCGEHVPFRIDPDGSWAECTACGHLS